MTLLEFSDEFDVLYNNIMSSQAPGLDEYEKSVFLTKAQDEIVKSYFNAAFNKSQEGFDDNERRQIDFSMLMKMARPSIAVDAAYGIYANNTGHQYYVMPSDIFLYINEALIVRRGVASFVPLVVMPLSYKDYNRLMSKPYKRPLKNQAWRLIDSRAASEFVYTDYSGLADFIANKNSALKEETIFSNIVGKLLSVLTILSKKYLQVGGLFFLSRTGGTTISSSDALEITSYATECAEFIDAKTTPTDTVVEIIAGPYDTFGADSYTVRYVARPRPIILSRLEGVTIGGQIDPQGCQLDPILHLEILLRAVELAKAAYTGDLTSTVQIGNMSATEKGVVTRQ